MFPAQPANVLEVTDVMEEYFHQKPVRQHVREFGALFALICLVVAASMIYKGKSPFAIGTLLAGAGVFLWTGYRSQFALYPLWKAWMWLAGVLSVVMTSVLLMICWFALMVPVAFTLKLFRVEVMDQSFRQPVDTYWLKRDPKKDNFELLERQF